MADEKENPVPIDPENTTPELEEAQSTDVRELRETNLDELPTDQLPGAFAERQAYEEENPDAQEAREDFESALDKPIEAIEDAINRLDEQDQAEHAHPVAHGGNTTVVFGQTIPLPLYTVVFGVLAAVTILEVIIAELPEGILTAPLLIGLSLVKAVLVVLFYMHLREDSRIFSVVLIIPLFVAIVSLIFLLSVPTTGY